MADFEEHWKLWRYAFAPNDTNAKRVVLDAFNKGRNTLARELYDKIMTMGGVSHDPACAPILNLLEGYLPVEEQETPLNGWHNGACYKDGRIIDL